MYRARARTHLRQCLGRNGVAARHGDGVRMVVMPASPRPSRRALGASILLLVLLAAPDLAHAYIGPGAGFAFAGSLLAMLAAFALAIGSILLWPFTVVYRWLRVGNPFKHAHAKRVVIVGMDGMDPGLATKFMREGRMPNLEKLAERGVFGPLGTS